MAVKATGLKPRREGRKIMWSWGEKLGMEDIYMKELFGVEQEREWIV